MSRYPAAYRDASARTAGLSTPVKSRPVPSLRVPRGLPKLPPAANLNAPLSTFATRVLPRLATRAIPYVGIAVTAYELYQWSKASTAPNLSNYTLL